MDWLAESTAHLTIWVFSMTAFFAKRFFNAGGLKEELNAPACNRMTDLSGGMPRGWSTVYCCELFLWTWKPQIKMWYKVTTSCKSAVFRTTIPVGPQQRRIYVDMYCNFSDMFESYLVGQFQTRYFHFSWKSNKKLSYRNTEISLNSWTLLAVMAVLFLYGVRPVSCRRSFTE